MIRVDRGLLCFPNRIVVSTDVVRHLADEQGARHVRAVAVHRTAEVDQEHVAALDHSIRWPAVRHGGARTGQHDRFERQALRPVGPEESLELKRNFLFGHARSNPTDQVGETRVGQFAGTLDGLDLLRGLQKAQRDELVIDRMKLDSRRRLCQQRPVRVAHHPRLHAERRNAVLQEHLRQLGVDRTRGGHEIPARCLVSGLLHVAGVGEDQRRVGRDQQGTGPAGGRPFRVTQLEAAEIAPIRVPADQRGVEAARGQQRPKTFDASRRHRPAHSWLARAMLALCSSRVVEK